MAFHTTFAFAVGFFLSLADELAFLRHRYCWNEYSKIKYEKKTPMPRNNPTDEINLYSLGGFCPLATFGWRRFFHPEKILYHPIFSNQ
jgi:hypothetical protein